MESKDKVKNYGFNILNNISKEPINNVCQDNNIEKIFDIYREYLTNIILAVESSVFKLCKTLKNNNNLYYKTIFTFSNGLLSEYFNKIYHSYSTEDDKYTFETFQELKNISNKEPYFHIHLMYVIIKDIYQNLNRLNFNINNLDDYLKSVEEEIYDNIFMNKYDIIQSYISNKNLNIEYNKNQNPFIFDLSTYDSNIQDIEFEEDNN